MNKKLGQIFLAVVLLLSGIAHGALLDYGVTQVGGATWRFNYVVNNLGLSGDIGEITTYFDSALYSNLTVVSIPLDWDSIVVPADLGIPADGFFDALALGNGILNGQSQGGFSVQFDFLGTGRPGSQPFELRDASFGLLAQGNTVAVTAVPEPNIVALLITGLLAIAHVVRRGRHTRRTNRSSLTVP